MAKKSNPYVIVRSHTAGVHAGFLQSRTKDSLVLTQSRRLWRWQGGSLSEVAVYGPASGENKFGAPVPKTEIISPQGFEIAHTTVKAKDAIRAVEEWRK
jgi:hypothetical protein